MGVSRDVTDRKLAQEALKTARDELEMRVKERTAKLQKANAQLEKQIEERMRAEAIIPKHYKINDGDGLKLLQRESRTQHRKLSEVAQAVISSKFIID